MLKQTNKLADSIRMLLKSPNGVEAFIQHMMTGEGQQNVFTPFDLCREIVDKLKENGGLVGNIGVLFNIEFLEVLVSRYGIKSSDITIFVDDKVKFEFCKKHYEMEPGKNLFQIDIEKSIKEKDLWTTEGKNNMKFDVIVMNPPYQTKSNDKYTKTQAIWPAFVRLAFQHCEDNGYISAVHPSGWRNVSGVYKDIQNLLKSKQMLFLKMHSYREGSKIFGANTNFDYYCIKNTNNNNQLTTIICEDLSKYSLDISKMDFIPSENITEIQSLIANPDEEKVEILHSYSDYETRKSWMSETKSEKFRYPCVYTVRSPDNGNQPTFWYSSVRGRFFGVPKVIWGNGASGVFVDTNGDYGLTQFAYAIVDEICNLENIKKALLSKRFIRNIMCFESLGHKYNKKIISTFRKDFWKEFI